ncbi:MAG: hypothetical protein ACRYGK_00660 [Janthinobacterium lividum]
MAQVDINRFALVLADANAFKHVLSTITLAEELRRDLAAELQILALLDAPEMALVMLTAAEGAWGKHKANSLMNQIIEVSRKDALRRAKAHKLVRQAITKMPAILWPPDKIGARRELLEELDRLAAAAHGTVALKLSKAEEREMEWRAMLAEGAKAGAGAGK